MRSLFFGRPYKQVSISNIRKCLYDISSLGKNIFGPNFLLKTIKLISKRLT